MINCSSEIIGVKSISLYLNSGIQLIRPDISNENEVNLIADGQGSYTISNPVLLPKWERIVGYSGNYKQNYVDEFKFLAHGVENEIPAIIKDLRNNRIGYIAEILTTGNQNYVFQSPVFLNNENTKQIDSHSWEVSLSYRIPSFLDKLTLLSTILTNDPDILPVDVEIVGIQRMALYINNDVVYRYLDTSNENEIALVSPVDPFIIINDINQLPKWERIIDNSDNYKQNYLDEFSFLLHGIENDVPEIIQSLRNNRLGYIVEILTTGNKPFIFRTPVFLNEDNTKQIDSHSWEVSLSYRIPSFLDKLTLTERPIVEYRNGIVTNSVLGQTAVFDFEAKISSNTQVTFTVNWGTEIGTTIINSTLVNGVWKALQTSILIPLGVNLNQTILVTDNFGDSFEVEYTIESIPINGLFARWEGGSILDTSESTNVYDGTLHGTTNPTLVNGINGEANGAYDFDSADDQYIDFGNIVELDGVDRFTISTWYKKTSGNQLFLGNATIDSINGSQLVSFSDNKIYSIVRDGSTPFTVSAVQDLTSFKNIIFVYKGFEAINTDRIELYIDNVLQSISFTGTTPQLTSVSPVSAFQMARRVLAVAEFADGQIAQTLVYDRVLTSDERATIVAQKTI